jgi:hypothetical protein
MEFLYSLNRLNVAVSRAQRVAVIIASPALFQVQCKTPQLEEQFLVPQLFPTKSRPAHMSLN